MVINTSTPAMLLNMNDSGQTVMNETCDEPPEIHITAIGVEIAMPEWEAIATALILTMVILLTVIGNILVILSVFTYKPLRIVQNFFIVSLAVADLTVALLVMPFNVAYSILGRWYFGISLCKMWLTCDVLCCTASILNLCAIALDRFWAITDPINYAQKRTLKRVLLMIAGIWALSLIISSPPLIGWNDWPTDFSPDTPCTLTTEKGYVIYSSLGSFYIPLVIMTIVYIEIFIATRRRLRERARASKISTVLNQKKSVGAIRGASADSNAGQGAGDQDSVSSETNHNEHYTVDETSNGKTKKHKKKKKKTRSGIDDHKTSKFSKGNKYLTPILPTEESVTDINPEHSSSGSNQAKNSAVEDGLPTANTSIVNTPTKKDIQLESTDTSTTPAASAKKVGSSVYQFVEEKQRISLSKERRAARTLGIIMGVFVVCWLPFFLMYVILPFCPSCCATKRLVNFITWLGYINSALNPIIYTIFNLEYRRAFKKLLGIKF